MTLVHCHNFGKTSQSQRVRVESVVVPVCKLLGFSGCYVLSPLEMAPFVVGLTIVAIGLGIIVYAAAVGRFTR